MIQDAWAPAVRLARARRVDCRKSDGLRQTLSPRMDDPMELILASTSPYRRTLMERLGVSFRCVAPPVDEEKLKADLGNLPPRKLAEALATAKAAAVAKIEPDAVVIGADQLVSLDDLIFGKPGTVEIAAGQLSTMAGRTHKLITALCVIAPHGEWHHTNVTLMLMRTLSYEEIARYVAFERPVDCAGGYKLESRGIALFERIETDDQTAIIGLPLMALTSILRSLGLPIP